MKLFLVVAALCIGASIAEVSHEEQIRHQEMLAELCKETGIFPNPHDPEGRTFIRCELEPVELRCDDGFIFDAEKLMCVEEPKPEPEPIDMDKVDWMKVLKCPSFEDKYYRNPYDCHRFYRCYREGHFERIGLGTCVPSMIFDDVLETCLPAEQFKSYYGHGCDARALPDEFIPGHEHNHEHEHENPNPDNHEHEHEHENPNPDNHEHENPNPDNHEHEHEHENPNPDNHEHEHENPNPDNHEHEHENPNPDNHEHEHENPNPDNHEHEHEHENPNPDNHEHENPNPDNHEHEHENPNPDNHEGEHENPDHHEGEHEEEHKHEPEPEKVPSLKDILKEIQDLFNKKH